MPVYTPADSDAAIYRRMLFDSRKDKCMSVMCVVCYQDGSCDDVQLADVVSFARYWEKPAVTLGLKYVPLFDNSFNFADDDVVVAIINELEILQNYWQNTLKEKGYNEPHRVEHALERIVRLEAFFREVLKNWEKVSYIAF
jgi:hypothetical protein